MADSIKVKRQILVRTVVTDDFRNKAKGELSAESKQLDTQLAHLEQQMKQLVTKAQQDPKSLGMPPQQVDQIINEMNIKHQNLLKLKQNLSGQVQNIDKIKNGELLVTGSLENYVDLSVGDKFYEKLGGREIIIQDGIIKEIKA